jgi:hypothetical protein
MWENVRIMTLPILLPHSLARVLVEQIDQDRPPAMYAAASPDANAICTVPTALRMDPAKRARPTSSA